MKVSILYSSHEIVIACCEDDSFVGAYVLFSSESQGGHSVCFGCRTSGSFNFRNAMYLQYRQNCALLNLDLVFAISV